MRRGENEHVTGLPMPCPRCGDQPRREYAVETRELRFGRTLLSNEPIAVATTWVQHRCPDNELSEWRQPSHLDVIVESQRCMPFIHAS